MTAAVVVVPAHDEAEHIALTVANVRHALDHAAQRRLVEAGTIEVIAHRCTDATATRARRALDGAGRVTVDESSTSVGQVRDAGVRAGLARLGTDPSATWVFSTDADTLVGRTWVAEILTTAARAGVVGVVGLAPLDRWRGSLRGAAAYESLLAAKMRDDGDDRHQHDHVYGANLAVRADAYLDVGGFPHALHGEDQALVDALAARGLPLLRTRHIAVRTSGRFEGRARQGLADRLAELDASA